MATGRVAKILKTSGQFSEEEIARMTENEAWEWIYANSPLPRPVDSDRSKQESRFRH